jgi:hypothetical protein
VQWERATHLLFSDHVTVHVLQLSEISERIPADASPLERMVHSWARFLGARTDEERHVLEGKAELLVGLLEARFGDIPEATRSRLLRAKDDEFRTWSRRVLSAASLDEVFAE